MRTFKHFRLRTGRILLIHAYAYLLPFKTPKGKKDALKATAPQSKYYKQNAKRTVSINQQDIHAKTYDDRNSTPPQKHHNSKPQQK